MLSEYGDGMQSAAPGMGQRNEPALVVEVARRLAALKGVTLEELAAATTANFARLFGLK